MTPQKGDDLADLLPPPHDAEFRRWERGVGVTFRYAGWQTSGYTNAKIIAVYGGGNDQKLLVKYVPKGFRETGEAARHNLAWRVSPAAFREEHLVRLPQPPFMLSEGGWVLFQEIAARELSSVRSMSALLSHAINSRSDVSALTTHMKAAVAAILGGWNHERESSRVPTAGEHLDELLGGRLTVGHPLREWAYERGLLAGGDVPEPTPVLVGGLPNPFAMAVGPHPARDRRLHVPRGRVHGDLHPGNVLLGVAPGIFWLVDLSRFSEAGALTYDVAYLQLTTAAHFLPAFKGEEMRASAAQWLVDRRSRDMPWLPDPYRELTAAIQESAESWAKNASLGDEWREATLLSLVAGGLAMCGRNAVSEADREWFLHVSAAAANRFVHWDDGSNGTSVRIRGNDAPGYEEAQEAVPSKAEVVRASTISDPGTVRARGNRLAIGVSVLGGVLAVAAIVVLFVVLGKTGGQADTPESDTRLVFDALGGGSPIISVYEGYTDSARQPGGAYNDGDSVPAVCKTKGRSVQSDPGAGERSRASDDWIRFRTGSGHDLYATAVYVQDPDELLSRLPTC